MMQFSIYSQMNFSRKAEVSHEVLGDVRLLGNLIFLLNIQTNVFIDQRFYVVEASDLLDSHIEIVHIGHKITTFFLNFANPVIFL